MMGRKDIQSKVIIAVGILFILGAILVYMVNHGVGGGYVNTTGVIVDIADYGDGKYSTTVRYKTDNGAVMSNIAYYETGFESGNNINIAYDKDDPTIVKYVDGNKKLTVSLFIIGIIFLCIGLIRLSQLMIEGYTSKSGVVVVGKVSEVVKVIDKDNEYYAVIVAENPLTNAVIEIRSEPTWGKQYVKDQEVKVKFNARTNEGVILEV